MNYKNTLLLFLAIIFFSFSVNAQIKQLKYKLKKANETDLNEGGKCQKCLTTIKSMPIEVRWNLEVINNDIYFTITDFSYIEKLFPNALDGIAIDLVARSQYTCGQRTKEPLLPTINRGSLLEPVYYNHFKKSIKRNEEDGSGSFKIASIPTAFKGDDIELNLLFIKDGTVCYKNSFFGVEASQWELLGMGLYMDTLVSKLDTIAAQKIVYRDLEKGFQFVIPFEKNKWDYSPEDIKPLYDSLRLTDYQIFNINIHAYASVEGSTKNNIKLQNKRAESIVKAMESFQNEKITTSVRSSENWVDFLNDLKSEGKTELVKLSKKELKNELNNNGLSKEFEPFLANHRKAVITLDLKKRVQHIETTNETVLSTYKQAIIDKDLAKALGLQQQLFERVGEFGLSEKEINAIDLSEDTLLTSLKNNQFVFNFQRNNNTDEVLAAFEALYAKTPSNLALLYNICALKVIKWSQFGETIAKPRNLKKDILKLQKADFDYKMTQRLLLNFHIARTAQSIKAKDYEAVERSVKFIKGKYRRIDCDDEDMIRVGKFLTNYGRIDWAEDVLYRKANRVEASPELIFYYLNITITNPDKNIGDKYKTIMYNAINKDPEKFCKMFTNYNEGGVTFQMLSNDYLKGIYCETCEAEEETED
jgi:hypothetical protein